MDHPIETFMLSFEESAVGQFRAVQPVVPGRYTILNETPQRGYQARPVLPAAAVKHTFMFQVFSSPDNKMITSTSGESLTNHEALVRRRNLLNQFGNCQVTQFTLPLTPGEFAQGQAAQDAKEPAVISCYSGFGVQLPGQSAPSPAPSSQVRVYLWNGSKWDNVYWAQDHWQTLEYVHPMEPSGNIYT